MFLKILVFVVVEFSHAVVTSLGFMVLLSKCVELCVEDGKALSGQLVVFLLVVGVGIVFLWRNLVGQGNLRLKATIPFNTCDTKVVVKFGDIFKQKGWRVVSVNDFFDSKVDGIHVARNSLHGQMIEKIFGKNVAEWDEQVAKDIGSSELEKVNSKSEKKIRYPLGTTAKVVIEGKQFLCVALGRTNPVTLEVRASLDDFLESLKKMLVKARSTCAGDPLCIPLIGSGLARVGIKNNILLYFILMMILEETKKSKITNEIYVVIDWRKFFQFDLGNLKKEWS